MSEADDRPADNSEAASAGDQAAPDAPLNRAQRRALASGKKSGSAGNKLGVPHQSGGNVSGHAGATPPAQVRMHTRSSNRGK